MTKNKKFLIMLGILPSLAIAPTIISAGCQKIESKEKVEQIAKPVYPDISNTEIDKFDVSKISLENQSGWTFKVKDHVVDKANKKVILTIIASKDKTEYEIKKEIKGFKETTTSEVELTEQQVKDQTTVDYPNKNTVLVKDIDKTKITVKTPS
ncbi:hypothetical protein OF363_02830, partial [Mycoplasma enhydrae]|uniref:hypothetical protein n=1 Tax=Mycoplasma enhydrae TaxID=2499220 RepID=UPI0021E74652